MLQRKHGDDGILYIHFTEDLTLLMLILCVLSCAIILPINMLGHQGKGLGQQPMGGEGGGGGGQQPMGGEGGEGDSTPRPRYAVYK